MYTFATILENRVRHLEQSELMPVFSYPMFVIDVTNYEGEVKERYIYDAESGIFTESTTPVPEGPVTPNPEPVLPESQPTLEEMQAQTLLNTEYLVIMSELTNL